MNAHCEPLRKESYEQERHGRHCSRAGVVAIVVLAQVTNDPFPTPIPATDGVITVKFVEFATIPDFNGAALAS